MKIPNVVFIVYIFVSMLKGENFKKYIKKKRNDKKMEKFRKFFFIPQ